MNKKVTFCILAGGKSSRFKSDKRIAKLGNKCVVDYVIDMLKDRFGKNNIVISTYENDERKWKLKVIKDDKCFNGPVCGIKKVVESEDSDIFVFLAADMPFVDSIMIDELLYCGLKYEKCLFKCRGDLYPLPFSILSYSARSFFDKNDCKNKSIKNLVLYGSFRVIEWNNCNNFLNINREEDLFMAEKMLTLKLDSLEM